MRRYLPALLLVSAVAPFLLVGCDDLLAKLKGGSEADAGVVDATAAVAAKDAAPAPTETAPTTTPTAAPTIPTAAPTIPTAAPTNAPTPVRPVVADGGLKIDSGAPVVADAGAKKDSGAAPAPTPTLTLPNLQNLLDGGALPFDAGAFKPPWVK